jgi:NADH-quinone oxidoreductase subunit A
MVKRSFVWYLAERLRLSFLVLGISFVLQPQRKDGQQISPYECGFDPFEDAREPFDVRFSLVAILFLLFDVEVAFLFPLGLRWQEATTGRLIYGGLFFGILTLGLWYEWVKGALDWSLVLSLGSKGNCTTGPVL